MTSIDMHCAIAERPGSPPPAKSAISIRARGAMARGSAGGSAGAQCGGGEGGSRQGTHLPPQLKKKKARGKKKNHGAKPSLNFQPKMRVCRCPARFCKPPRGMRPLPRWSPRKFSGGCGGAAPALGAAGRGEGGWWLDTPRPRRAPRVPASRRHRRGGSAH